MHLLYLFPVHLSARCQPLNRPTALLPNQLTQLAALLAEAPEYVSLEPLVSDVGDHGAHCSQNDADREEQREEEDRRCKRSGVQAMAVRVNRGADLDKVGAGGQGVRGAGWERGREEGGGGPTVREERGAGQPRWQTSSGGHR